MVTIMKRFITLLSLLSALLLAHSLSAQELDLSESPYFCDNEMGKLPILQAGRVKPLYVHANEVIKQLTGKRKINGHNAVMSYCLLSIQGLGLENKLVAHAPVEHVELKTLLSLEKGQSSLPFNKLNEQVDFLRSELARLGTETNSYRTALNRLLGQIFLYREVIRGENWTLPLMNGQDDAWLPLAGFLTEQRVQEAAQNGAKNPFLAAMQTTAEQYQTVKGPRSKVEYYFAVANLPMLSMIICFLALATMTLFRKFPITLALASATVVLQTIYVILRIYISERAPITNMYETVLFSGYGALVLAMLIGHFKQEKIYLYMGLGYNVLTLFMMNFAHGMLNPSISPLVPVLRDNFWLSTHVTTVIMSYGAYALSWILANTLLFKKRFGTVTKKDEVYYSDIIYTCLKYGSVMLAGGVLLGGVWADYSWGRFWGWDPKETWSLIALCIYIAIQHGRYTNWIPNHIFIPATAAAFMSIMMAWFGVNYILASGLHSYGFSEGGALFLGSFFFIQTAFILITIPAVKKDAELKTTGAEL